PPQWSLVEGQHRESLRGEARKPIDGQFLLYLPQGFSQHSAAKYPLLIFLHGSGQSGFDIDKVKSYGPPKFLDTRPDFPFIVASPQAPPPPGGFDPDALNLLLDQLLQRLPIDKDRVYLTGFSMGGFFTYAWASVRPGTFAAIAPVSGAWIPDDACKLRSVPIWAFHGAKDEAVKMENDEAMVNAIKACGGDIKFTVYPDIGHSADPAYADPQLYQWLLQHRLDGAVAKQIAAFLAACDRRYRDQTPAGNTEPTIRRLVTDFSAGTPDYSQMNSTQAAYSRRETEHIQAQLAKLGALNSLLYNRTEKDGSDVYDGEFANGQAQFRLRFQEDGKIANVDFYPAP
ncbi:MAG TPA: dienelactone hydrolase family protein, partial [Steroidobacteraceae bacterium]